MTVRRNGVASNEHPIVFENDLYKQTEFIAQRASDYVYQPIPGSIIQCWC